jgi:hypothetical protein
MGLDMYLDATRFLRTYGDDNDQEVTVTIKGKKWSAKGDFNKPGKLKGVTCNAIYWRKANAIHKWFVDNVQSGEDNCGTYYVSRQQLIQLKELCEKVLANKDKASELLPIHQGFFFGTYEYDERYWDNLTGTIKEIDEVLEMFPEEWDFEYTSSW